MKHLWCHIRAGRINMKVVKRAIIVDAMRWDGTRLTLRRLENLGMKWSRYSSHVDSIFITNLTIYTLEGAMMVNKGDYVIKGNRDEFYPCKTDVFNDVYDILEADDTVKQLQDKQKDEAKSKLTKIEDEILIEMCSDGEMCSNYSSISYIAPMSELKKAIKHLKEDNYIKFYRGLMTEDGEVAGSGWCRTDRGNNYMEKFEL